MNVEEIRKVAQEYIQQEKHEVFRKDVEGLLEAKDDAELRERFYTSLSFGTGGLRGVIGGGTNRMNTYMVRRATQGLADYIISQVPLKGASVAISYDCRHYSDVFAQEAALVLASNGIKAFVFKSLRPTPELSFTVRELGCTAGIMVTASHNPPEYNGYKVYWNDGAQVVPPHDKGIIQAVREVDELPELMDKKAAMDQGLYAEILEDLDKAYIKATKSLLLRPELFKSSQDLKVVFTPLHGTGGTLIPGILQDLGLSVLPVEEQMRPDGAFPTVKSPNPEEASALAMGLELGKSRKADLLIGTDPDADRIGIAVPDSTGQWVLINGNQLGVLLTEYMFSTLVELKKLPEFPVFINTIVTTELQNIIAQSYGAETYRVLTGFKWIAEKIRGFEEGGTQKKYILGGEESYGFLIGTQVRDKDSVSAALLTVEMALYLKSQGRSVLEELDRIYKKYGYYQEIQISKTFKGESGLTKMKTFMEQLRSNPPAELAGLEVAVVRDYLKGVSRLASGEEREDLDVPASDVLQFAFTDGTLVSVRPSGTEPKIKFYASCRGEGELDQARKTVAEKLDKLSLALDAMIS